MTDEQKTPPQRAVRGEHPASLKALEESRAKTQFGGEKGNPPNNTPGGANTRSWSIRHSIRYLARQPVDLSDPKAFSKVLPPKPTIAQVIAANTLSKASKADMRAVECVIDQIDGKVPQVNVNTDLERFEGMTEEELHAYNRALDERIAAACRPDSQADQHGTAAGADTPGADAAQGNGGAPAGEGEGAHEGAAAAGSNEPIVNL